MTVVVASTREVEGHLIRLLDLVEAEGGTVAEGVRVCEQDGDFYIEAPSSIAPRKPILQVPRELLLPVGRFDLRLSGDEICIGEVDERVSATQVELMETQLALYNATGKIKRHRETSTFPIYKTDFELFSQIAFPNQIRARADAGEPDLLHDFLRTRVLSVPASALGEPETGAEVGQVDVLMPLIDFLNHHPRAGGYTFVQGKLTAVRGNPAPGSDECFICYGRHDAQSLLFTYGYLDRSLEFAFSAPMTLSAGDGKVISIFHSGAAMNLASIPARFDAEGWILPAMLLESAKGTLQISHLPIYSGAGDRPFTRRLLEYALPGLLDHPPSDVLLGEVVRLEREIIAANIDYFERLAVLMASKAPAPEARLAFRSVADMIEVQLRIMRAYWACHLTGD